MAAGDALLLLEVKDFKDPQHWRWVLKDDSCTIDDHEVNLEADDPEYVFSAISNHSFKPQNTVIYSVVQDMSLS